MNVLVIGGGVSGLSSALRLLDAGHIVTLWGRELSPHTTSDIAAAIWHPYKAYPPDKIARWAEKSLVEFKKLASVSGSGVSLMRGRVVEPERKTISTVELPFIEMPIYLPFLMRSLKGKGGIIEQKTVTSLNIGPKKFDVLVNCTGLGARDLTPDDSVFPIRGHVLRVTRPACDEFLIDENHPAGMVYVIPRSKDCILGGTCEEGLSSLEPDAVTSDGILARCRQEVPLLAECDVLEVKVGLRPARPEVRVETKQLADGRRVIHNYGHGGSGVTISWGCADDVVELVTRA